MAALEEEEKKKRKFTHFSEVGNRNREQTWRHCKTTLLTDTSVGSGQQLAKMLHMSNVTWKHTSNTDINVRFLLLLLYCRLLFPFSPALSHSIIYSGGYSTLQNHFSGIFQTKMPVLVTHQSAPLELLFTKQGKEKKWNNIS